MTQQISPSMQRQLERLFRGVRHTLLNRGLYRKHAGGHIQEVTFKRTILLEHLGIVLFEVDTQRLPVKIEKLLHPEVAHQIQATLGGRKVQVTNSRGLVFGIRLDPEEIKPVVRLPKRVDLTLEGRPEGDYLVPVGMGGDGVVWRSLYDTGHILVGGESGSGKSTWLHTMLLSLLDAYSPLGLQLALVDPKMVEFQGYQGLPHLISDVATEPEDAARLTTMLMAEVEQRRVRFASVGAKNLESYNTRSAEPLPLLLFVVDEVTDIALQAGLKSTLYTDLIRLTSKGRAFGLVIVLATQNPKAEVLNTLIRGNMSTRIAFRVSTVEHSRTILGVGGAQKLPRTIRGRMLARIGGEPMTLQGLWVSEGQIEAMISNLSGHSLGLKLLSDEHEAMVRWAVEHNAGYLSIADIQSALEIGEWSARKLATQWEDRSWLCKDPDASNKRRVTTKLLEGIERD